MIRVLCLCLPWGEIGICLFLPIVENKKRMANAILKFSYCYANLIDGLQAAP